MRSVATFTGTLYSHASIVIGDKFFVHVDNTFGFPDRTKVKGTATMKNNQWHALSLEKTSNVKSDSSVHLNGRIVKILSPRSFVLEVTNISGEVSKINCFSFGKTVPIFSKYITINGKLHGGIGVRVDNLVCSSTTRYKTLLGNIRSRISLYRKPLFITSVTAVLLLASIVSLPRLSLYVDSIKSDVTRRQGNREMQVLRTPVVRTSSSSKVVSTSFTNPSADSSYITSFIQSYTNYLDMLYIGSNLQVSEAIVEEEHTLAGEKPDGIILAPQYAGNELVEVTLEILEEAGLSRVEQAEILASKRYIAREMENARYNPNSGEMSYPYSAEDVIMMAKMLYGEAGCCPPEEQRLVIWCVFNRIDSGYYGNNVYEVVTPYLQFVGYRYEHPVLDNLVQLVKEEWTKWQAGESAPICPPYAYSCDYLYFNGHGGHNWFRTRFNDPKGF